MARDGINLVRNAGKIIPVKLIEKILERHKSLSGLSFVEEGAITTVAELATVDVDSVTQVCEGYPDKQIAFHFGHTDEISDDDLQPYTLRLNGGNPTVVAYIEGDTPGIGHPSILANETLIDEIDNYANQCNDDIDKLMGLLDAPKFRTMVQKLFHPRGCLTLVATAADPKLQIMTFGKDTGAMSRPWGWCSKTIEYEAKAAEPPKAEEKPLTMKELIALKKAGKVSSDFSVPKASVPEGKETKPPVVEPEKTDTKIPDTAGKDTSKKFGPPASAFGKELRKWFNRHIPGGWDDKKGYTNQSRFSAAELKPGSELLPKPGLDTLKEDIEKQADVVVPALIPQGQKRDLVDKFIKEASKELMTAEELRALADLEETPDFFDQTGCPVNEVLAWPYARYRHMGSQAVIGLAVLCDTYRHMIIDMKPELLKAQATDTTAEEAPVKKELSMKEMIAAKKKSA